MWNQMGNLECSYSSVFYLSSVLNVNCSLMYHIFIMLGPFFDFLLLIFLLLCG